jgi:carboxyl-terminal processing protease
MRFIKKFHRRITHWTIAVSIACASVVSLAFLDDNFEITKNLDIYYTLFKELNLYYVDDVNPAKLIQTSIDAMLKSLDPYTTYIPESQMEDYKFMTTGQYGGLGALIRKSGDYIVISEPYEGSPAHKADLRAGDIIIEIDGRSTKGKSSSYISEILKGQPGTTIKLVIRRPGTDKELEKTVEREEIQINPVAYYGMLNEKIGYINLSDFTNTAYTGVRQALILLREKKAESIILDLRGNPGGLLIEAVNISNLFVKKDQEIVNTKGKLRDWEKTYRSTNSPVDTDIPLAILVNSGSASASEIVAGAMQDLDRAVIIGQRTYGKGLVQTTRDLSFNSKLKVTTAKYYIPSGRCIQAVDYSNRNEDGSVGKIPDSLMHEFKTLNGRKVFDGGGILPDIITEPEKLSKISISLLNKNLIFDWVTDWCLKHPAIPNPGEFNITDSDYSDFIQWLSGKDFDYSTQSDEELDKLIELSKNEKYYEQASGEFDALKKKLAHDKNKDLKTFQKEIRKLLTEEIVSRYYLQKGRIEWMLKYDPEVLKAMEILSNPAMYKAILDGTWKGNN